MKEDKRSFYVLPTEKAKKLVATAGETTKNNLQILKKIWEAKITKSF